MKGHLLFIAAVLSLAARVKPEDFCNIDEAHVLCHATGIDVVDKNTTSLLYPTNQKERDELLNGFNEIREKLAKGELIFENTKLPNASRLMKLKWCDRCERAAWLRVADCNPTPGKNCCKCIHLGDMSVTFTAKVTNLTVQTNSTNITAILNRFIKAQTIFDESCLDSLIPDCVFDHPQLLFLGSDKISHVGCAYTICKAFPYQETLFCFYSFNQHAIINQPLYKQGPPCDDCPSSSKCTNDSNLCECTDKKFCAVDYPPAEEYCKSYMNDNKVDNEVKTNKPPYCQMSLEHILCNASGKGGVDPSKTAFTFPNSQEDKDKIIANFNRIREKIALGEFEKGGKTLPNAANLLKLEWCNDCENAAWTVLKNCKYRIPDPCCQCFNTGEMTLKPFHWQSKSSDLNNPFNIEEILKYIVKQEFAIEDQCIEKVTLECFEKHWQLMMLASHQVTHIGCAFTKCKEEPHESNFLCFYNFHLDHIVNLPLYSKGPHCTKCKPNSNCNQESPILCECEKLKICHEEYPSLNEPCPTGDNGSYTAGFGIGNDSKGFGWRPFVKPMTERPFVEPVTKRPLVVTTTTPKPLVTLRENLDSWINTGPPLQLGDFGNYDPNIGSGNRRQPKKDLKNKSGWSQETRSSISANVSYDFCHIILGVFITLYLCKLDFF